MTPSVQSGVMAFAGVVLIRLVQSDTHLRYVKDSMGPWLLLAGGVLVVLGVASWWADGSPRAAKFGGHGHHDGPRSAWLVVLPLLVVLGVAPPSLGAYAADRLVFVAEPTEPAPALPEGDPVPLPMWDYASRAVWEDGEGLRDRTVLLTGFTVPTSDGGWDLSRLSIACCAADAFASTVRPVGEVSAHAPGTWVEVVGRWVPGGETRVVDAVPLVAVDEVRPIDPPREPYE